MFMPVMELPPLLTIQKKRLLIAQLSDKFTLFVCGTLPTRLSFYRRITERIQITVRRITGRSARRRSIV